MPQCFQPFSIKSTCPYREFPKFDADLFYVKIEVGFHHNVLTTMINQSTESSDSKGLTAAYMDMDLLNPKV